jgi:hypothetical protein
MARYAVRGQKKEEKKKIKKERDRYYEKGWFRLPCSLTLLAITARSRTPAANTAYGFELELKHSIHPNPNPRWKPRPEKEIEN